MYKTDKIKRNLLLLLCFTELLALGQTQAVSVQLDKQHLRIGEQTKLHLTLQQAVTERITFPPLKDTLVSGLEIVSSPVFDTIFLDNENIQVHASVLLTAFDAAEYDIPSLRFVKKCNGEVIMSNPLKLNVETIPSDSLNTDIRDIKPIYEAPNRHIQAILFLVVGLLLLFVIFLILKNRIKKKTTQAVEKANETPMSFEELKAATQEKLKRMTAERCWKHGQIKEYYTELSDVLRQFIASAYGIDAMEMTSEEILSSLSQILTMESNNYTDLRYLFILSDLVKFAKHIPQEEKSEEMLQTAFDFVTNSAQIPNSQSSEDVVS